MTVAMFKPILCTCGKLIMLVSDTTPQDVVDKLCSVVSKTDGELHVLSGENSILCGSCGALYYAPAPEMFDVERSEFGAWLQELDIDI